MVNAFALRASGLELCGSAACEAVRVAGVQSLRASQGRWRCCSLLDFASCLPRGRRLELSCTPSVIHCFATAPKAASQGAAGWSCEVSVRMCVCVYIEMYIHMCILDLFLFVRCVCMYVFIYV